MKSNQGVRAMVRNAVDEVACKALITGAFYAYHLELKHPNVSEFLKGCYGGYAWGMAIAGPLPLTPAWFAAKVDRARDAVAEVLFRVAFPIGESAPRRSFPAWDMACARSAARARELGLEDLARDIEG